MMSNAREAQAAKQAGEQAIEQQAEKAFQKQPIFNNAKVRAGTRKAGSRSKRWYKDVGLGFKTPSTAINGTYIDKKCPFTGEVSIRGRILVGKVISTKMTRTIVIRRDYLRFVPKYSRYEKRHKNMPLSKTVRFNVLRVTKNRAAAKAFQKF